MPAHVNHIPPAYISRSTGQDGVLRYRVIYCGQPLMSDTESGEDAVSLYWGYFGKEPRRSIPLYDGDFNEWREIPV